MEHWRAVGELGLCWEWSGVMCSEAEDFGVRGYFQEGDSGHIGVTRGNDFGDLGWEGVLRGL